MQNIDIVFSIDENYIKHKKNHKIITLFWIKIKIRRNID